MKIEIAEHSRMTESGSSLLRLIQNNDMPLLGLLVRESVQNSLDAAIDKKSPVIVEFNVGKFCSRDLSNYFEGISGALNKRFASYSKDQIFISIKDSNTVGLTGPVSADSNEFGNLQKLVYEISKPQTTEGAGGSWGLGKTIYFRLGIGLVIYYSHIKEAGKYKSRLAACLVENELGENTLIPNKKSVKRGIAWWGQSAGVGKSETVPITDENDINRILSVFGLSPYKGNETGTTVIIPYADEQRLLSEVYPQNENAGFKPYWAENIEEYLKVSLQRWYAPRIFNVDFPGNSYLIPIINGKRLKVSSMLSLFRVIREMYIYGTTGSLPENSIVSQENANLHKESVGLRNVFDNGSSSGDLVYIKMTSDDLNMLPPNNEYSPFQQITDRRIEMIGGNNPIITFTRRPGMLVGYDYSGQWTHGMPKSAENEYVIGLFITNSENRLKEEYSSSGKRISLEEYIRKSEKADHAGWYDHNINGNNPRIIAKIQSGVIKKISTEYKEKPGGTGKLEKIGLSRALADLLLPGEGFGTSPTGEKPPKPPKPPFSNNSRRASFRITSSPSFRYGSMEVDYVLTTKKTKCTVTLAVMADKRKLTPDSWEKKELEIPFPIKLTSFSVDSINSGKKKDSARNIDIKLQGSNTKYESEELTAALKKTEKFSTVSSVEIYTHEPAVLIGRVSFKTSDPDIKASFEIEEEK